MKPLKAPSPQAWVEAVLADFDAFLLDHAAAEKKASGMAMQMVSHYPDKPELVKEMIDLALEEMSHFRQVAQIIYQRGLQLGPDAKDPYVLNLRKQIRKYSGNGPDIYFLDRLLIGSVIEARGCERFGLIAEALPAGHELKGFYNAIARSESEHEGLFYQLALKYFEQEMVETRHDALLDAERDIMLALPIRPILH